MNKTEQKIYLKKTIAELRGAARRVRYRNPDRKKAPKKVLDAIAKQKSAQRVIDRWEAQQNRTIEARYQRMQQDFTAISRSFAFDEPSKTLALCDQFKTKYAEYLKS